MGVKRSEMKRVMYRDIEIPLQDLAKLCNVHPSTLIARVNSGWNVEAACIADITDLVRYTTSNIWLNEKANKKKADALYVVIKQHISNPPKKPGRPLKAPDQATIDRVLAHLKAQRKLKGK